MTSQSKSKAQRRAENQQRAAERRAAELRQKRLRIGVRVGGAVVVVALVVVLVTQLTGGGSTSVPPQLKNPHVPVEAIPASMSSTWVQPPATQPGPETVGITTGPKLATLINVASGQTVDGIQCNAGEQTVVHVHTHLTIFVNGQSRVIPYGVGIPGFQAVRRRRAPSSRRGAVSTGCTCTQTTGSSTSSRPARRRPSTSVSSSTSGVSRSARPRSDRQPATSPPSSPPLVRRRGSTREPRNLPLGDHYQIQLDVGTPIVAPVQVTNWGGL